MREAKVLAKIILSIKSRDEYNSYINSLLYFCCIAIILFLRVVTGTSLTPVFYRVTGSILKTVIVVFALYFEALEIGEIKYTVQESFRNHKIDFIGFLLCFVWLKVFGFISIKCFLYSCPDIEKYFNIHYYFDAVRIYIWCLPVFLIEEILSHLDHFCKNKSAGNIAFFYKPLFSFCDNLFIICFLFLPLYADDTSQIDNYLFVAYKILVTCDFIMRLLFFVFDFRQYMCYRKVYTDKTDSEYTIVLVIPEAIVFPYLCLLVDIKNPFFISDRTIGMMKTHGFSITVCNSDFRKMDVEWKKAFIIVPYDFLNDKFLTEWKNDLYKYAKEKNVPYLYESVFDDGTNNFVLNIRKEVYEEGNQANALRYGYYITESFDNLIYKIASTSDRLRITEELIQIDSDFRDTGMEENIFTDSLKNIFNEIYYSSDCFYLCEYCIKYFEEINHFMTLAFIEGFNLPINDALKQANVLNYLKTGTYGSWKDLREFLQNKHATNSKTSKTVSFLLARYNAKMAEPLSGEIKEAIRLVMSSINYQENDVNDVSGLINKLVLFRNATTGHGTFTYEYSINLAIGLIKICVFLTGIFNDFIVNSTGHNLKELGWVIEIEGERYFAYSYYSGRGEFSYYSYKLHSVYTTKEMNNQSLSPVEDNLT